MPRIATNDFAHILADDYTIQNGSGGAANFGDAGSVIVWTSSGYTYENYSITEDGDGNLEVYDSGDFFIHPNFAYSGYTIDIGGNTYPVFEFDDDLLIPSPSGSHPANFNPRTEFPDTGTSNPYTGQIDNWVFCYLADTGIATPGGEVAVQDLSIGDMVTTASGKTVPVKWIGRQVVNALTQGAKNAPVLIEAGALGNGLPHTNLRVTADHGMVLSSGSEAVGGTSTDDLVINASALVNGTTIRFLGAVDTGWRYTVYHIETGAHDVILANGAASETFVDAAGRANFDNYAEYLDLYGSERIIPEMSHPRINAQRLLPDAIKARLGIMAVSYDTGRQSA